MATIGSYIRNSPNYSHFAYNLEAQAVQRIPSGLFFDPKQINAGRGRSETWEKGIDPHQIFPTSRSYEGDHLSNGSTVPESHGTEHEMRCLPLLGVNIDVEVHSSVSKTKVMQTFTNQSNYTIEETNYSFPLYDGSTVISFRCHVGEGKLLEGVIKSKEVSR
jgi:hypothetical protein